MSIAGNVGHVAGHDLASRVTAAVPPLAAASALAVGLGVLKPVVAAHAATTAQTTAPSTAAAPGDHAAVLAVMPSKAAAVRHAIKTLSTQDTGTVTAWLARQGVTVTAAYARDVASRSKPPLRAIEYQR